MTSLTADENALSDEDANTYIDLGFTAQEAVLLRWPEATPEMAQFVLWNLTTFPMTDNIHDLIEQLAAIQLVEVEQDA